MKKVLTIAGSDSIGGAGIQADIKTMMTHGIYAMSAVTAVTAQNTMGVKSVNPVSSEAVGQQIEAVFEDIRPDAVKIGLIANEEQAEAIAERLKFYHAENIVTDPVAVSTSGHALTDTKAYQEIAKRIFPLSRLVTPNISEAEMISGEIITNQAYIIIATQYISKKYNCAVLCKGGHFGENADDFLFANNRGFWFNGIRIKSGELHGTGCTLSSAIASNLAKGHSLKKSIYLGKQYVADCIATAFDISKGSRPLNHMK